MATAFLTFLATVSVVFCAPAPTFIGYAPPLLIPASDNVISVGDASEVKNASSANGSVVVEDFGHNYLNSLPAFESAVPLYPGFLTAPPAITTTVVEGVPSLYPYPPLVHGGAVFATATNAEAIVPFLPNGTPGGAVLGKPSGISTTVVEGEKPTAEEDKPATEEEDPTTEEAKQEAEEGKQEAEEGKQEAEEGKQEADEGKQEAEEGKQEAEEGKQEAEEVKPLFVSEPIVPYLPNGVPGGAVLGTPSGISTTVVEEPKSPENKSLVFGAVPTYLSPFGHPGPVTFFAPPLFAAPVVSYAQPPGKVSTTGEESTEASDDGSYKATNDDESVTEKVDDDGLYKGDETSTETTETTETSEKKTESTLDLKTVAIGLPSPAIVPVFPAHYFRPPNIFVETEARAW